MDRQTDKQTDTQTDITEYRLALLQKMLCGERGRENRRQGNKRKGEVMGRKKKEVGRGKIGETIG